jgi:hypothetical protein
MATANKKNSLAAAAAKLRSVSDLGCTLFFATFCGRYKKSL